MRRLPVENKTLTEMGQSITIHRDPDEFDDRFESHEFYLKDKEFQLNKVYRVSFNCWSGNKASACYIYFDKPVVYGPVQAHEIMPTPTGFYGYYGDSTTSAIGFAFEENTDNFPTDWIIINLGNCYYLDALADW